MCNFGAHAEWRNGRRSVSFYLDVDIINDQYRLVNTTPLDCVKCYIMEDAIGDRDLRRLHQRRLKLIYGSISSYQSILNSPERLCMTKQASKLESILCDIQSDHIGSNDDRKNILMEEEDHRNKKSEQKYMMDDYKRLKGLENFEVLVHSVL